MKDKVNEGKSRDLWEEIVLLWKNWNLKKSSSFTKTFLLLLYATLFLQILLILGIIFAFP